MPSSQRPPPFSPGSLAAATYAGEQIALHLCPLTVTRLKRDCAAGLFGPARTVPLIALELPAAMQWADALLIGAERSRTINWDKVATFMEMPSVLSLPVIAFGAFPSDEPLRICDGVHRATALVANGVDTVPCFIVPEALMPSYILPAALMLSLIEEHYALALPPPALSPAVTLPACASGTSALPAFP